MSKVQQKEEQLKHDKNPLSQPKSWAYVSKQINPEFQVNKGMQTFIEWFDWICHDLPPGPPIIPMRYYVNLHKGGMPFLVFGMMVYYDNFSLAAYLYLALHGSYGIIWVLKDYTFPDGSFQRKVTLLPFVVGWFVVLQPYTYGAYLICSKQAPQDPSPERVCVVTMIYCIGVVLMMGADGQKYFTLRERKGLMDDGYMKWSRNPNYVGEMMIYSSFALLTQRIEPWYVLGYMWTLIFLSRMLQKDYSLSKKAGWREYASTSWMLPFKFGGSTMMSIIIYGIFFYTVGFCWSNGGMEKAVKLVLAQVKQ